MSLTQRGIVFAVLREHSLVGYSRVIGAPSASNHIEVWRDTKKVFNTSRIKLQCI